jgi:hypothetical protein
MSSCHVKQETDGSLPSGLKKLRLVYVCDFEPERVEDESMWFKSSIFGHLTSLALVDMMPGPCACVETAVKVRFLSIPPFLLPFPPVLETHRATPDYSVFSNSSTPPLKLLHPLPRSASKLC